jgi:hypothetical protein
MCQHLSHWLGSPSLILLRLRSVTRNHMRSRAQVRVLSLSSIHFLLFSTIVYQLTTFMFFSCRSYLDRSGIAARLHLRCFTGYSNHPDSDRQPLNPNSEMQPWRVWPFPADGLSWTLPPLVHFVLTPCCGRCQRSCISQTE